ncbi:hypothetical protein [Natranaerofaba carboxydovora]|uniref:hypothetical protein n=1 Tax=Natranaerofaba carboxydovora TaxID=2742683 RepID=UPI001F144352|nr:hypothetical protein [Natranaerofaba carboxydovora]UMZ73879.1 hypothetical protein ACONDI_01449 [Natranaerofaba carboxydovora]
MFENYNEKSFPTFLKNNDQTFLVRLMEQRLVFLDKEGIDITMSENTVEYIAVFWGEKVGIVAKESDSLKLFVINDVSDELNENNLISREVLKEPQNIHLCCAKALNEHTIYLIAKRELDEEEELLLWQIKEEEIKELDIIEKGSHFIINDSSFQIDDNGVGHLIYVTTHGNYSFLFYRNLSSKEGVGLPIVLEKSNFNSSLSDPILVLSEKGKIFVCWVEKTQEGYSSVYFTYKARDDDHVQKWSIPKAINSRKNYIQYLTAGEDNGRLWFIWWNNQMEGYISKDQSNVDFEELTLPSMVAGIRFSNSSSCPKVGWGNRAYGIVNRLEVYRPLLTELSVENQENKNYETTKKERMKEKMEEKMKDKYELDYVGSNAKKDSRTNKDLIINESSDNENILDEDEIYKLKRENEELKSKISELEKKLSYFTRSRVDNREKQLRRENKELKNQIKELKEKEEQKSQYKIAPNLELENQINEKENEIQKLKKEKNELLSHTTWLENSKKELEEKVKKLKNEIEEKEKKKGLLERFFK